MPIELIIIGDEILNGRTKDANLAWLAPWLFRRGLKLNFTTVVGDEPAAILTALNQAWQRANIVITSGGIGPTLDDLTKGCLAEFSGRTLVENNEAKKIVETNYARLQRPWNPNTNGYHILPTDFIATDNPMGLAPGLVWFDQGKVVMAAPGVPREFASMVEQVFFPLLEQKGFVTSGESTQVIMRTYGVPEEKIFGELCPDLWRQLEQFGKVSSLPHLTGVDVIISHNGLAPQLEKEIRDFIETTALSSHVWQWGGKSLEEFVLQKAREAKATLAFAESCTGGLVASRLTDVPGYADVFLGSAVTYANSAKEKMLGVNTKTLKEHGAVSEPVALEMARGACDYFGADFAVSFSGIAGPTGGSEAKPVGMICQGLASKHKAQARTLKLVGDRLKLKERFALTGLFWLLEELT